WRDKYGSLIRAGRFKILRHGELEWKEEVVEELFDLPPRMKLTTRSVWPSGVVPRFMLEMEDWWPLGANYRITLLPHLPNAAPMVFFRNGDMANPRGHSFDVHGIAGSAESVTFDVRVDRERPTGEAQESWRHLWAGSLEVAISFDHDPETPLEPVQDTALTEAMWQAFSLGLMHWRGGPKPVRVRYAPQQTYRTEFNDIAIGVHVDVMKGDYVARRLDLWWLAGTAPEMSERGGGWESEERDLELLQEVAEDGDWYLRVTGDVALALRAGNATKYWAGEFVLPIDEVDRGEGQAPRLRWWTYEPLFIGY
ncbi:MAG: hypothetical protein ACYTGC_09770, partial [Planctomycetota bacterium]